jgi:hypothetical protein
MAGNFKSPESFFGHQSTGNPSDVSRSWSKWLQQFDFYMLASEKNEKAGEVQVAILLTILGPQGQEIFETFDITEDEKKDIDAVKAKFTSHFKPQTCEVFERFKFFMSHTKRRRTI